MAPGHMATIRAVDCYDICQCFSKDVIIPTVNTPPAKKEHTRKIIGYAYRFSQVILLLNISYNTSKYPPKTFQQYPAYPPNPPKHCIMFLYYLFYAFTMIHTDLYRFLCVLNVLYIRIYIVSTRLYCCTDVAFHYCMMNCNDFVNHHNVF